MKGGILEPWGEKKTTTIEKTKIQVNVIDFSSLEFSKLRLMVEAKSIMLMCFSTYVKEIFYTVIHRGR